MESTPSPKTLWRCSPYADISGRGGLVASGRWHTKPRPVVYCSECASTTVREVLRQVGGVPWLLPENMVLIEIAVPPDAKALAVSEADLDPDWCSETSGPATCRLIGDRWLEQCATPLLRVPSAARPGFFNFLINPVHRACDDFSIMAVHPQPFPNFAFAS